MTRHPGIEALAQIVPDGTGSAEQADWAAAEARWSTRLPFDYVAFMARYGGGSISAEPGVLLPLPQGSQPMGSGDPGEGDRQCPRHLGDVGPVVGDITLDRDVLTAMYSPRGEPT